MGNQLIGRHRQVDRERDVSFDHADGYWVCVRLSSGFQSNSIIKPFSED